MSKYLLLIMLLLLGCPCVSGRVVTVKDEESVPLPGVVISMLTPADSLLIDARLTDEAGHFEISDTIPSYYILQTRYAGYEAFSGTIGGCPDTILLQPHAHQLHEVTVMADKDLLRQEAGKFIFTPGRLMREVSTAYDLLPYVPLLTKNSNDRLEMVGKSNCVIYINGRDPHVSNEQLLAELRTMPPDWIKSIEVVVAPGSTLSATASTGIINIILVDRRKGFRGNARAYGSLGEGRNMTNDNLVLTFGHDRFQASLYSMIDASLLSNHTSTFYTYSPGSVNELNVNNDVKNVSNNLNWYNSLSLNYQLSKRSLLSVILGMDFASSEQTYTSVTEKTSHGSGIEKTEGKSRVHSPWLNPGGVSGQIFYTFDTDGKGSRLEAGAMIQKGRARSDTETEFGTVETTERHNDNKGLVALTQYTQVFSPAQTLKGGYRLTMTGLTDAETSERQRYSFDYTESIHAAFLQWTSQWGPRWTSAVGIRVEHARTKGESTGDRTLYDRKETDVTPSLSVAWSSPDGMQSVSLAAGRMISRPQYQALNPYRIWTSDNTFTVGNPDLKSSKSWKLDLYYFFLRDFILNVSYSDAAPKEQMLTYGSDGYTYTTRVNAGLARSVATTFEFNKVFFGLWRIRCRLYYDWKYAVYDTEELRGKNIYIAL